MNEKAPLPKASTQHESHTAEFEGKTIDVYKLIDLADQIESTAFSISAFEDTKQNKYWHDSQGGWLGPQDVIDTLNKTEDVSLIIEDQSIDIELKNHIYKVLNADYLAHPIIIIKGEVKDGMHRLTKAFIDGVDTIDVKEFSELPDGLDVTY